MFVFGLNKTQNWAWMALLLLCTSIRPNSSHPRTEENYDQTEAEDRLNNNEEYQHTVYDDGDDSEAEEVHNLEETTSVENDGKDCVEEFKPCSLEKKCCVNLRCLSPHKEPNNKKCYDLIEGVL